MLGSAANLLDDCAFRVRKKRQVAKTTTSPDTGRTPRETAKTLVRSTQVQLAMFRDLRQARRTTAGVNVQLTQANRVVEQQRREHEHERQALQERLATALQQREQVEAQWLESTTRDAAQRATDAQTIERLTADQRQAAARIAELEREARTAAAHQNAAEQLQNELHAARRQLAAVDAARVAAEARSQALDAITKELSAEQQFTAALFAELEALRVHTESSQAKHKSEISEAQGQLAAERQELGALRDRLREATSTGRQQRDQLDNTALALSRLRAAREPLSYTTQLEKLKAELSTVDKELMTRTDERDFAQALTRSVAKLMRAESEKLTAVEKDLADQKAHVCQYQGLWAEVQTKMDKAYAQLLRIKENKDWRL